MSVRGMTSMLLPISVKGMASMFPIVLLDSKSTQHSVRICHVILYCHSFGLSDWIRSKGRLSPNTGICYSSTREICLTRMYVHLASDAYVLEHLTNNACVRACTHTRACVYTTIHKVRSQNTTMSITHRTRSKLILQTTTMGLTAWFELSVHCHIQLTIWYRCIPCVITIISPPVYYVLIYLRKSDFSITQNRII